jgi:uncharacterized phiE125 gp8 family phage protein
MRFAPTSNPIYKNPMDMVELVEAHLFLPLDNSISTQYVESCVQEVVKEFEKVTRRNLFVQEYQGTIDLCDFENGQFIKAPNVKEIVSVNYLDKEYQDRSLNLDKYRTIISDKFIRFIPIDSTYKPYISSTPQAITITVKMGMIEKASSVQDLPADLRKAFKQHVAYLIENHGDDLDWRIDPLPYNIEIRGVYSRYMVPLMT